jgi:hypothetical protein
MDPTIQAFAAHVWHGNPELVRVLTMGVCGSHRGGRHGGGGFHKGGGCRGGGGMSRGIPNSVWESGISTKFLSHNHSFLA